VIVDPVKTKILKRVLEVIEAVPMVKMAKRNPPAPPKHDTAIFPAVWVYDDTESKKRRNRYSMNIFTIQTETYFLANEEDASDQADLIDAEIYKALLADTDIRALVVDSVEAEEENSTSKQFVDEFMGVVISRFIVKYAHAWGDPFDQAK
jgi:hypothetical protein